MQSTQKYVSRTVAGLLTSQKKTRNELSTFIGMQRRSLYDRLNNHVSWTIEELDKISRFFGYKDAYQLMSLAASQETAESNFNVSSSPALASSEVSA